jgi:hypothetical protein
MWGSGTNQAPYEGAVMSDKSPRQSMSEKSSKTLKQKRAAKRAKAQHATSNVDVLKAKQR